MENGSESNSKVMIGDREFALEVLPFKDVKKVAALTKTLRSADPEQVIDVAVEIIYIGVKRGNEDVTKDWLEDHLTMKNYEGVTQAILKHSGFRTPDMGEPRPAATKKVEAPTA